MLGLGLGLHGLYFCIKHDFSLVDQSIVDLTHKVIHTASCQLQPHHFVPICVGKIRVADTVEPHASGYPMRRAVQLDLKFDFGKDEVETKSV